MKKNLYVSPAVEVIEVAVEAGIAASAIKPDVDPGEGGPF